MCSFFVCLFVCLFLWVGGSVLFSSSAFFSLQVMPFSLTQGGKCVAHVLQKHKPKRALVFVRAKGE